jgi:hypothetical protein
LRNPQCFAASQRNPEQFNFETLFSALTAKINFAEPEQADGGSRRFTRDSFIAMLRTGKTFADGRSPPSAYFAAAVKNCLTLVRAKF